MAKFMASIIKKFFGEPSPYKAITISQEIKRDREREERKSWAALERRGRMERKIIQARIVVPPTNKRASTLPPKDPHADGGR